MNVSTNETQPNSDACLLPVTHIIALILVNLLSIIIGTTGNALVIATVYTNVTLQIISNFWLASMAVADLMVTVLAQPLLVALWGLQLNRECNEPVVETFRLVIHMSCSASVLHLCFISIDRCLLIIRPFDCKKIRTLRKFKIMVTISWTIPVIFGVLSMIISRKATSYFVVIASALCYLIIISCYTLIVIKVWNRKTETLRGSTRGPLHLVERRVTVTIAVVVVVFTICWVPLMYLRPAYAESNVGVAYMWWGGGGGGGNGGFEQFSNEPVDLLFSHDRVSCYLHEAVKMWVESD